MYPKRCLYVVLAVFTLPILLAGCSEPTPEEKVAMLRARYEAKMNGFFVEQRPVVDPVLGTPAEASEDEQAADEEDGAGDVESVPSEPIELVQDVFLDIEVRHESPEKLDGITVDITMVDSEQREVGAWRAWFDTSALEKGPGFQYSHKLEDVDFQDGYGFSAEVRHPVPPGERAEYREFSSLGG